MNKNQEIYDKLQSIIALIDDHQETIRKHQQTINQRRERFSECFPTPLEAIGAVVVALVILYMIFG